MFRVGPTSSALAHPVLLPGMSDTELCNKPSNIWSLLERMIRTADHNLNYIDNYEVLLFVNLKKKEEREKQRTIINYLVGKINQRRLLDLVKHFECPNFLHGVKFRFVTS